MSIVVTRSKLAARDPRLEGLRVLVIGLGRSGLAAARLAVSRGAHVTVTDARSAEALGRRAIEAKELGVDLHLDGTPQALAENADLVVLSPGVPPQTALVRRARRIGLPVWGEIELAARFCRNRVIGVTGSNGKSTVTTMIAEMIEPTGSLAGVGGNLETPFAELLGEDDPSSIYVLELSSFQLETAETLNPEVAVILNLSPDHLDRYDSYDAYAGAKARLLELQSPAAYTILNADDPESRRFEGSIRGKLYKFSTQDEVDRGAFLSGSRLVLRTQHGEETLLDRSEMTLPGDHNVANALAASLAARLVGCPAETIAEALRGYRALPHRLEYVATVNGVKFFNDSKATNPASTARALTSFEPGKVHLILGGKDKGSDWSSLVPLIRKRARRVLLVGQCRAQLAELLDGEIPLLDCETVGKAVETAPLGASSGDVVLLSPGCASFDQYSNFEERGDDFRESVGLLVDERGSDA